MSAQPAPPLSRGARRMLVLLWLLLLVALAEVLARTFWHVRYGVGLLDTRAGALTFYPELETVLQAKPARGDSVIDILLLGGSTINPGYGAIPAVLQERLAARTRRKVRVFTLGVPGHTSRDSFFKYRALGGVRFDVVVLYNGFNDARVNNVPPGLFRDDYSHYRYYQLINDVHDAHRLWPLALPYTLVHAARAFAEWRAARAGHPISVPMKEVPDTAWTAFGGNVRTAGPFRRNTEAILDMAARRGDPIVLLTFAAYFAPGYTEPAFRARRLDYTTHRTPLEIWGRPEFLAAGLAAHNAVLRDLHAERPNLAFVDMEAVMPHGREFYNDVCHFTVIGSERFVDALLPAVLSRLDSTLAREAPPITVPATR